MDIKANIEALNIPANVTLVAVSKMQPRETLQAAVDAGLRVFGENRVQEAHDHWADIKPRYPDLRLHLIGTLQTNKVADAIALFDVIETLDREKLADALADEMQKQGRALPCLIQVNTGREPQKGGVAPDNLDALYAYCRKLGLNITGLMCIPPADEAPVPHFKMLADAARRLNLKVLSMGMSADYPDAMACGATHVRVGSALFGQRQTR
jgi:pyridoxal phosphate enzyme (YggS family)